MRNSSFFEFARYVVVGGLAFVADFVALIILQEFVFKAVSYGVYISAVFAFCVGLLVNYLLSITFVFTSKSARGRGRTFGAFILFSIICVLGLVWTELGMWVGIEKCKFDYKLVKIVVSGIVLFWNYFCKKYLIFR